jgi:hypothetical protein
MEGEDLDGVEGVELDADTKAYFESGGEKLPAEPAKQPDAATEKPAGAVSDDKAAQAAVEGDKQPTTVPLRALQEEREEKKALREELRKISEERAILSDRWQTLLTMQQEQPKADADPEPDPNKDIFAHNAWLKRQFDKLNGDISTRNQQEQQARQVAEGEQKVWNYWHQDAAAYKAQSPEFDDAVKWASEYRTNQLKAMASLYPQFGNEQGIVQQINSELRDLVITAAKSGVSPAKAVHDLAKSWGYKGKAAEIDPAKVIADANKGKDAEVSLSTMGGSAAPGPKSAEDVAAMSPTEFEAWLAKNGEKGFRRLMGG